MSRASGPRYASRERAEQAFQLRASRHSWREVCEQLGYRSVGAAQTAVNRHVERNRRGVTETTIEAHKYGIELRTRAMSQKFVAAFAANDTDTLVALNREIRANEAELAKLAGMYAPERAEVNVTVEQTPAAILAEATERLKAALATRQPQGALPGNIIEGEVIP